MEKEEGNLQKDWTRDGWTGMGPGMEKVHLVLDSHSVRGYIVRRAEVAGLVLIQPAVYLMQLCAC